MTEYVWGVDVATGHLDFAFVGVDHDDIATETLVTRADVAAEGQRWGWFDRQVRIYVRQVERRFPPACIFVERPTGARDKTPYELIQASGVTLAAIYEALSVPVFEMAVSSWKKAVIGHGNASKAMVASWVAHNVAVDSQDQADAYCVALAGRDLLASSRRAAA